MPNLHAPAFTVRDAVVLIMNHKRPPMTEYIVQFVLPVDNPEKNVVITKKGQSYLFEVPINYPDAHKLGFTDLVAAAEISGLFRPSSTLNTDKNSKKEIAVVRGKVHNLNP